MLNPAFRTVGTFYVLVSLAISLTTEAMAQSSQPTEDIAVLGEIVVLGETVQDLGLEKVSEGTGSRLGLSILETPATVEVIDSEVMRARGYGRITEAVQVLPGVVSGESPAAPSGFSMRGLTRSEITVLRDGIWLGPTNMVMRPQNTFNLDRVEVLRGPASVLHGQGVVAGTVNAITRAPYAGMPDTVDGLVSYGRYNSQQFGTGVGGAASDQLWYRADISRRSSDGYVDGMDPQSLNATGGLLWQPNTDLSLKLSIDYLDDDLANYWGTPLVPIAVATDPLTDVVTTPRGETLDGNTRRFNYNVSDARAESDQLLLRGDINWQISDRIELHSTIYNFDADREWLNSEGYVYCTAELDGVCTDYTGQIQRYWGYFYVFHDQDLVGNRTHLTITEDLFGRPNTFVAGLEVTDLDFVRTRGFRWDIPVAPADSVDLIDPVPGVYGPEEQIPGGLSPTTIETRALFLEDALEIAPRLSLVGALRYEELDLDRKSYNAPGVPSERERDAPFTRAFDWVSWRAGGVFKVTEDLVAYGSASNARDPVNQNIFLVPASENFDLTEADQFEVGLKSVLLDGRAEATFAYYEIERDDVLGRLGRDSATSVGGRESSGVELAASVQASAQWRIAANAAFTDAAFSRSSSFSGNTPPNVPEQTFNLWTSYRGIAGTPAELGGAVRYVGERFGDNANTVTLADYWTVDGYVAWNGENYRITARVNNLFDTDYVPWSDVFYLNQLDPGFLYANQLILGAPRTWELSIDYFF